MLYPLSYEGRCLIFFCTKDGPYYTIGRVMRNIFLGWERLLRLASDLFRQELGKDCC